MSYQIAKEWKKSILLLLLLILAFFEWRFANEGKLSITVGIIYLVVGDIAFSIASPFLMLLSSLPAIEKVPYLSLYLILGAALYYGIKNRVRHSAKVAIVLVFLAWQYLSMYAVIKCCDV